MVMEGREWGGYQRGLNYYINFLFYCAVLMNRPTTYTAERSERAYATHVPHICSFNHACAKPFVRQIVNHWKWERGMVSGKRKMGKCESTIICVAKGMGTQKTRTTEGLM
jgi:hypothetical protein